MDDPWTGATPREQEAAPEPRGPVYLRAEHDPLPDGVREDDEGAFVIRLVAATLEDVAAARAAEVGAAKNVAY